MNRLIKDDNFGFTSDTGTAITQSHELPRYIVHPTITGFTMPKRPPMCFYSAKLCNSQRARSNPKINIFSFNLTALPVTR